jgi:hypothetical protein
VVGFSHKIPPSSPFSRRRCRSTAAQETRRPLDVVDDGGLAAAALFGHRSRSVSVPEEHFFSGKLPLTLSIRVLGWRGARRR